MVVFFEQLIKKSEFHSLCTICLRSARLLFQENQIEINLLKKKPISSWIFSQNRRCNFLMLKLSFTNEIQYKDVYL
jgi:hypothetical protein